VERILKVGMDRSCRIQGKSKASLERDVKMEVNPIQTGNKYRFEEKRRRFSHFINQSRNCTNISELTRS